MPFFPSGRFVVSVVDDADVVVGGVGGVGVCSAANRPLSTAAIRDDVDGESCDDGFRDELGNEFSGA